MQTWIRSLLSAVLGLLTAITFLVVIDITFQDLVLRPALDIAEQKLGYGGGRFAVAGVTLLLAVPPTLVIHRLLRNVHARSTKTRMSSLQWITLLMASTFALTLAASILIVAFQAPSGPLIVAIFFAAQLALEYLLLKAKQDDDP